MTELYDSKLGKIRIGKKAVISYDRAETIQIEVDVIAVDHRFSFGHHEYKVKPIGEGVRTKGWFRNLKWYRPDEVIEKSLEHES